MKERGREMEDGEETWREHEGEGLREEDIDGKRRKKKEESRERRESERDG
jgi:hypothetical protein